MTLTPAERFDISNTLAATGTQIVNAAINVRDAILDVLIETSLEKLRDTLNELLPPRISKLLDETQKAGEYVRSLRVLNGACERLRNNIAQLARVRDGL